jgi:hypothetical protein
MYNQIRKCKEKVFIKIYFKRASDYFTGEIKHGKDILSRISGSYVSHIEFDGVRYWDIREVWPIKQYQATKPTPSSSLYRTDRILLEEKRVPEGQTEKERLENIQRADRKLRELFQKK